jgi:lambda family phage portal protein
LSLVSSIQKITSTWLRTARGYDGAKKTRAFRSWFPSFGSPDGEIIQDLPTLRARSRDLYRNNPVARGAIDLMVSNVVGRGLRQQCAIDREVIQKYTGWDDDTTNNYLNSLEIQIEKDFARHAESKESDYRGQRNFYENIELAFKTKLTSGEAFCLLPMRRGKISLCVIEADQVQSPYNQFHTRTNRDGIETEPDGTPIAIHVNKNQETYPAEFERILIKGEHSKRTQVIHLYNADRPGQTRGVPFLAPVIQLLKHLDEYRKSELIRAKVVSLFSVFIRSQNPNALNENTITEPEQDDSSVDSEGRDFKLAPGSVHQLLPGEDINFANPGNISSNYTPLAESIYTEIGMALRTPMEILRRYYSSSYSAARGSKADYKKEIMIERQKLELGLCVPYYAEWFTEQVLAGRYYVPGFWQSKDIQAAYVGSTWEGDAMGMIDPQKEIDASNLLVQYGYSNKTEETASITGGDYMRNLVILNREKEMRKHYGLDTEPVTSSPAKEKPLE